MQASSNLLNNVKPSNDSISVGELEKICVELLNTIQRLKVGFESSVKDEFQKKAIEDAQKQLDNNKALYYISIAKHYCYEKVEG